MAETPIYKLFVSYADDDRAWAEGFLMRALAEAGLPCVSEASFAPGVPRIKEFERVIQQSERTLLVLSPAYLADTDSEFVDLLVQTYDLESATQHVIPLIREAVALPLRLAMLTSLEATPDCQDDALAHLCRTIRAPLPPPAPPPPCPYPGMVPFSEAESDRFFGREDEIKEMVSRLQTAPFLSVIGPSGSGKSSLVFAGVLPALRKSDQFGAGDWAIVSFRPGEQPLASLTAALGGDPTAPADTVQAMIARQPGATRALIVVDQFEELFTLGAAGAAPFVQAIIALIAAPHCFVVLTVRADFYPDLMATPLWEAIQAHRLEVVPLAGDHLREAINQPAEDVDVYIEAALIEQLLLDAADEPGALPLMQETLLLLWEHLERRFLPLRAYQSLAPPATGETGGAARTGLQVAIADRADATLAALTAAQQVIAKRILLRLIQFGEGRADTRRQQTVAELQSAGDDPATFAATLSALTDRRLLTIGGDDAGSRTVDIAHEALITGWPTLQTWIGERREAEQTRRRLEEKADEWVRLGRGAGGLLDAAELPEAVRWQESADAADLGTDEALTALVQASQAALVTAEQEKEAVRQRELAQAQALAAEQQRVAEEQRARADEQAQSARRLRRRAVLLTVAATLALVAFVGATVAAVAALNAQRTAQMNERIARSRQYAAIANNQMAQSVDVPLLVALEAYRAAPTIEARSSLLAALENRPHLIRYFHEQGVGPLQTVVYSPDGALLASGSDNGTIIVRDAATGQLRYPPLCPAPDGCTLKVPNVGTLPGEPVRALAFSPNGALLASGDLSGAIVLWETATGKQLPLPPFGQREVITGLSFDRTGTLLASSSTDRSVMFWDVATGAQRMAPLTLDRAVTSVSFSPSGSALATATGQGVTYWDIAANPPTPLFTLPTGNFRSVAFSADGNYLAVGGGNVATLWDIATRKPIGAPLPHGTAGAATDVTGLAFSPDSTLLAVCGNNCELWDLSGGAPKQRGAAITATMQTEIVSAAVNRDGTILATGNLDGSVALWETAPRALLGHVIEDGATRITDVAVSPNGAFSAYVTDDGMATIRDFHTGATVSRPTGRLVPPFGYALPIARLAFNPDGSLLALSGCLTARNSDGSDCEQGGVYLFDTRTGAQRAAPISVPGGAVQSLAISKDGVTLAMGSNDGRITLWNLTTGAALAPFPEGAPGLKRPSAVLGLAFSPDGKMLAAGEADGSVIFMDVAGRKVIGGEITLLTVRKQAIQSVAFSPDGTLLASAGADGQIVFWDVAHQRPTGVPLTGITNATTYIAFSPDGNTLASVGGPLGVDLWDVTSRQPYAKQLTGVAIRASGITFSSDGKTLLTAGGCSLASPACHRGEVIQWDVDAATWQERACHVANRNLLMAEWDHFLGVEIPYRKTCPALPDPPDNESPVAATPVADLPARRAGMGRVDAA